MIKKAGMLAVMAVFTLASWGQEEQIQWYGFEEAYELNKKEPKKIMVVIYADWCGWCTKMKNQTLSHPQLARYINENFYPVYFNGETSKDITIDGTTFSRKKQRRGTPHNLTSILTGNRVSYPSVAFLDEGNNLLRSVAGFLKPKAMEQVVRYFASEAYKEQSFKQYRKNFTHTLVE